MANVLLTDQVLTWAELRILRNSLKVWVNCYDGYEDEFGKSGAKIGSTLMVRKPQRFIAGDGPGYDPQPLSDTETPVVCDVYKKVHFEFSSTEKTLSLDKFSERYLMKAGVALANQLDYQAALALALNSFQYTGVPGTTPTANTTYTQANAILRKMGFPAGPLTTMIINSDASVQLIDTLKTLFNPQATISRQNVDGLMGKDWGGSEWYEDEGIAMLTTGVYATAGTVTGSQTAAGGNNGTMALLTGGWTSGDALNAGDKFTIGTAATGVHSVNPQTRVSTGKLQQFVVLQSFVAPGGGAVTIQCAPAITPSGQYQNVDIPAAGGMQITPWQDDGSFAAPAAFNSHALLDFHRDAMAVLTVPLDVAKYLDMGYADTDEETGIRMRMTRSWNNVYDVWPTRIDILGGYSPLYREAAVVIASS
jgi:P22 coat protein - gene protein 5